jgi:hypothetical protein
MPPFEITTARDQRVRAVLFFAVLFLRAAGLREVDFLRAVLFFAVLFLRAAGLRAVLFFAVLFFAVLFLRAAGLRAVAFLRVAAAFLPAVDRFAAFRFRVVAAFLAAAFLVVDVAAMPPPLPWWFLERCVLWTRSPLSGRHALQASAFPFAHAPPDPVALIASKGVVQALDADGTLAADPLGLPR